MTRNTSRTGRVLQAVKRRLRWASEGSVLRSLAESVTNRGAALVRNSSAYRWLTAEPEPDVLVIDLRETRTVGPFVRLLERVRRPVERAWANSRMASVTAAAGTVLSDSRTGRVFVVLFEPPDPPDEEDGGETE